jgi:hypothetical protein
MLLESLAFVEFPGTSGAWRIERFTLGRINLLVGRNASGKSRLINVINSLGKLFSGETKEPAFSAKWRVHFREGDDSWDYTLEHDDRDIQREELVYNGANVITRGPAGLGRIQAEDVEEGQNTRTARMRFQVPLRQIAVVVKRDAIQHPYLEALCGWGAAVRHFQFGYEMRPHNLAIAVKRERVAFVVDEKDTSGLVPILDLALRTHGETFSRIVMADMAALGYEITELKIRKPENTVVEGILPGEVVGVAVKEADLGVMTDQHAMSQGMFRSLSLLIQTTHYMLSNKSGCILVDDIGEGLDFERSCILIDLIRDKATRSTFQLIMSTNNRFVMNRVPLEEWCVLERKGGEVRVRNYANSAAAFERFKVTGLNNFDLLATNYLEGK